VKIIARLTYRQRYEQSTGARSLAVSHCQSTMDVWRIWHPTYGVIYDEGEVIKRAPIHQPHHELAPEERADVPKVRP